MTPAALTAPAFSAELDDTTPLEPIPARRSGRWLVLAGAGTAVAVIALVFVPVVVLPAITGGQAMTVLTGSMAPELPVGHIGIYRPVAADHLAVGDIIAYQPDTDITGGIPITHRVISLNRTARHVDSIIVQGDANPFPDPALTPDQVLGRLDYAVPHAGLLKVLAFEHGLEGPAQAAGAVLAGVSAALLTAVGLRGLTARRSKSAHVPG